MKQSKINTYFGSGDMKAGASGSAMYFRHLNGSDRLSSRDLFHTMKKDPNVIFEKITRKKEKQRIKFSTSDNMGLESDLSSQNSSQMFLNSQFNSQNSQSIAGNSSYSDEGTNWYQPWINRAQQSTSGLSRSTSRCSSRQSFPGTNQHSQDFKQCMDNAKQKSKEKEERDMLFSFLSLVKECCEDTKTAVNSNTGKCDARLTEGFSTSLEKMNEILKHLSGIENLFKSRAEYEDKIDKLEKKLESHQEENVLLRTELDKSRKKIDETRSEADKKIMEKFTDAFDNFYKGQQKQSDKIEEFMTNTKSILNTPKLQTADVWCQYSPPLSFPAPLLRGRVTSASDLSTSSKDTYDNQKNISLVQTENVVKNSVNVSSNHRFIEQTTNVDSCQSHPFVVPSNLPPRLPNQGNQRPFATDSKSQLWYPHVHSPYNPAHSVQPVNHAPKYQSSAFGMVSNSPASSSRSVHGSPFQGVGFARNKLKNSPIAAIIPRQHSTESFSKEVNIPTDITDTEHVVNTSRQPWKTLADNQSQSWFSRNTRSNRTRCLPGKETETENIPQPTTVILTQSKGNNIKKNKPTKRKRRGFTRKKGKTGQKAKNVQHNVPQDNDDQKSMSGSEQGESDIFNFKTTREALTEQNHNIAVKKPFGASPPPRIGKVKQEFKESSSPFLKRRKDDPWPEWMGNFSEGDSSDGVIFVSQENKENHPIDDHWINRVI